MQAHYQLSVSTGETAMRYTYDTKFEMLIARENEISLGKWSGAHLHSWAS